MDTMTTTQAAQFYQVSPKTIRRWIHTGILDAERVDGRWLITPKPDYVPSDAHADGSSDAPDGSSDAHADGSSDTPDGSDEGQIDGSQNGQSIADDGRNGSSEAHWVAELSHAHLENATLKARLTQADFEVAHVSERVEEKTDQIRHLRAQLSHLQEQNTTLAKSLDQCQQLLAVQTKTSAALTDRLTAIEDRAHRSWFRRVFRRD
jgi:excisionase family DNA binding protein